MGQRSVTIEVVERPFLSAETSFCKGPRSTGQIIHRHTKRPGKLPKRGNKALLSPGLDLGHGDAVHARAFRQGALRHAAQIAVDPKQAVATQ
jgi:hypothetical protein